MAVIANLLLTLTINSYVQAENILVIYTKEKELYSSECKWYKIKFPYQETSPPSFE